MTNVCRESSTLRPDVIPREAIWGRVGGGRGVLPREEARLSVVVVMDLGRRTQGAGSMMIHVA